MWVRKLIRAIDANGYSGRNFLVIPTQIGPALCWFRFAGLFGAYGDEGVEDVYLVSSLLASLIVAVAVVCGANRLFRRPSRGN